MNWFRVISFFTVILLALGGFHARAAQPFAFDCSQYEFASGKVIIGYAQHVSASFQTQTSDDILRIVERKTGSPVAAESLLAGVDAVQVPAGQECAVIQELQKTPAVAFAELDYRAYSSEEVTPNDPEWTRQANLALVGSPLAWGVTTGTDNATIAIIDSGIDLDHPDLMGKLWNNSGEIPGNQIDDDGNGKVDDINGWHFYHEFNGTTYISTENADVQDDFGHGTHVAGIAAAATNNSLGVAGMSWGSSLMVLKVLDADGLGFYSDIIKGIDYAVENGANIINLSLGGPVQSAALESAVDNAAAAGVVTVAAAGNNGMEQILYPAAFDSVIAVGASTISDTRSSYSNYGTQLDLVAPGDNVLSTWYHGNYFTKSGTSMATPLVSGAAALLVSQDPSRTPQEVRTMLRETAEDIGDIGYDVETGWGRLNVYRPLKGRSNMADLWVSLAMETASDQQAILTVTYGNRGGVAVEGALLQVHIATESGTIRAQDIGSLSLPAISTPAAITFDIPLLPGNHAYTFHASITSTIEDYAPTDNHLQESLNLVGYGTYYYLPLLFREDGLVK